MIIDRNFKWNQTEAQSDFKEVPNPFQKSNFFSLYGITAIIPQNMRT